MPHKIARMTAETSPSSSMRWYPLPMSTASAGDRPSIRNQTLAGVSAAEEPHAAAVAYRRPWSGIAAAPAPAASPAPPGGPLPHHGAPVGTGLRIFGTICILSIKGFLLVAGNSYELQLYGYRVQYRAGTKGTVYRVPRVAATQNLLSVGELAAAGGLSLGSVRGQSAVRRDGGR